ncbi:MAG: hypothetical protein BWZ03_00777 [bacterium ADurb.BinA186]|nr:MAG: hypothetical protein BWZ03_00777 [bacterium ADurb.BinA186]
MDAPRNHPEKISLVFLKLVVYFSMILCAAIILLTRPYLVSSIREAYLSPLWLFLGPLLFLVLFIGFLVLQSMEKSALTITLIDLLPVFFGIGLSVMLLHAAYREYDVRTLKKPLDIDFIAQFTTHKDARIRALAILALSASQFDDQYSSSLIHRALLDKDPVVQQAAKSVIEENLGIRFKNGAEGTKQAQDLMLDTYPSALLTRKGSP